MPGLGFSICDSILNMPKGWIVVYKDGSIVTEQEMDWKKVRKKDIKILALKWGSRYWTLSGKSSYLQFKRGAMFVSTAGMSEPECIERCIGYYEGASKIIYRVDENTGQMRIDVQE